MSNSHDFPEHIFRAYDIRGLVEDELTESFVAQLAQAYATWLIRRGIYDTVLGHDCRHSSPAYTDIIVKSLLHAGITVYDIGMTLSPIAYFAQYVFRTRGLIMVTASHNPKEYNGFKFGAGFSQPMLTSDIQSLKNILLSRNFMRNNRRGEHHKQDIFQLYLDDLIRHLPVDSIVPQSFVVDACAGTAGPFIPRILRAYGCSVIEQNCTPDGSFPVGTPDPTDNEVQQRLGGFVTTHRTDLGAAYDCDGDRLCIIDKSGVPVSNDSLCALYAQDILDRLPHSVIVYNTLCSKQVEQTVRNAGGKPCMWKTGHSFIESKIREESAAFGGEVSGHFYFCDNFYGHEDSAYATLRLLAGLTRTNRSLEEALKALPQYITSPEIKVSCPDELKELVVTRDLAPALREKFPNAHCIHIDGIRVDTDTAMCCIRASQNGPYITLRFESAYEEEYQLIKRSVRTLVQSHSDIDIGEGVNYNALA